VSRAGPGQESHRRALLRNLVFVALTITSGCANAVCFLRLGHVFASVITGNLVLLGISVAKGTAAIAGPAGLALGGYAAGVIVGAPIVRERGRQAASSEPTWPARVTACLAGELMVLAAFSVGWEVVGGRPGGAGRMVLLAVVAGGMGMQSAAVRRLGQVSTTYLTSTLTGVLAALVVKEVPDGVGRSIGLLLAIAAGAAAGAATTDLAPGLLPVVLLAPLGSAIAVSQVLRRY
jgi:uncharacterized membrane protein YoaK (UPF0700 family)